MNVFLGYVIYVLNPLLPRLCTFRLGLKLYCCDKDPVVLEAARARLKVYYKVLKRQNILKNINQMPPTFTSRELKNLWFAEEVEVGEDESVAGGSGRVVKLDE